VIKVALAQINATVGDLAGNAQRIVNAARRAHAAGAQLLVAPELALCGYPPEDLLLRPAFMQGCAQALAGIAAELVDCEGLQVLVGHPHQFGERGDVRTKSTAQPLRFNAASLLSGGRIAGTYCKRELPNYQVFDERRYFASGRDAGLAPLVFAVGGVKVGVLICEDAWFDEPAQAAKAAGAQVLAVINASPFHLDKGGEREQRMAERARAVGLPLLYSHLVGGQDEVVFDGASFVLDASGTVAMRAPSFVEALAFVEIDAKTVRGDVAPTPSQEGRRWSLAYATTSARTVSPARSSACRAASIRPWCWRSPSTRSAPTRCAP
jgi:NAD+ synthase (glutamine-hydrolysing)